MRPVRARRSRPRIRRTQQFKAEISAGLDRYRAKLAVPARPSGLVLLPTIRRNEPTPIRRHLNAAGLATVRFDVAQGLARVDGTELTDRLGAIAQRIRARTGHPVGLHASRALAGSASDATRATEAIGALSIDGNDARTLTDAARWLAQRLEAGDDLEEVLRSFEQRRGSLLRRAAAAAAVAAGAVTLTPSPASATVAASYNGTTDVLNIAITNDAGTESATVTCSGGSVLVNGAAPSGDAANCSEVLQIIVNGSTGNDVVDLLQVTSGNGFTALTGTTVDTGQGADSITGSDKADTIQGGENSDTLAGEAGNDRYVYAGGDASYNGDSLREDPTEGTDVLDFSAFTAAQPVSVNLAPAAPANAIVGQPFGISATSSTAANFENAVGGAASDVLRGNAAANTLDGGAGNNDGVGGFQGNDSLVGGTGTGDRVFETHHPSLPNGGFTLTDTTLSGLGSDTLSGIEEAALEGGTGNNNINASAFSGTAFLFGLSGTDTLAGAAGASSLDGDSGTDSLTGGGSGDTLVGGADADTISGGLGNDLYTFSDGATPSYANDQLQDAGGTDSLDLSTFTNFVNVNLTDFPLLSNGVSTASAASTETDFENVTTGSGVDFVQGNTSANTLNTGAGNNEAITGKGGNDSLIGGGGTGDNVFETADVSFTLTNSSLSGLGMDTLSGFEGATLTGGGAANAIDASGFTAGPVSLFGIAGNDTLTGTPNADSLDGDSGNDSVVAGDGEDSIIGGADNDSLNGGDGTDLLTETVAGDAILSDTALSGNGSDLLSAIERAALTGGSADQTFLTVNWSGPSTLSGVGGRDLLQAGSAANTLLGGSEDDTLFGGVGNDSLDGGAGTLDRIEEQRDHDFTLTDTSLVSLGGFGGTDTLVGIEGATLTGGTSSNVIDASGFSGRTELLGDGPSGGPLSGTGDQIVGGSASDTLIGQFGDDTIEGGPGSDSLVGGDANDRYVFDTNVGTAGDTISESLPNATNGTGDTYDFSAFTDAVDIDLGNVGFAAETGSWTLSGTARFVETAIGGSGNDTLTANNDANSLDGGAGNDRFIPVGSGDTLIGGSGDGDRLVDAGSSLSLADGSFSNGANTHVLGGVEEASLTGTAGDDVFGAASFSGSTTLAMGDGLDSATGGSGADSVVGSSGLDTLTGGGGGDTLVGESGSDTIDGGAGGDTLNGGLDGDLYLFGSDIGTSGDEISETAALSGTGNDFLDFESAPTTSGGYDVDLKTTAAGEAVAAGNGGWTLVTSVPVVDLEEVSASEGDDTLRGDDSPNSLYGGNGNDRFFIDGEPDSLDGGNGTDTVAGTAAGATLNDTTLVADGSGSDTLASINAASLTGLGTSDLFDAQSFSGPVTLASAGGNDTVLGGLASDSLIGNEGADSLAGGAGSDTTVGGTGNDIHAFGQPSSPETDLIREFSSGGTDEANFSGTTSPITADLRPGTPVHLATHANRTVGLDSGAIGAAATPTVENLTGGDGNDSLTGSQGINTINGGLGNDTIGATFKDVVNGGGGAGDRTNVKGFDASEVYNPGATGLQGVELLNVFMLGGNDQINVATIVGLLSTTLEGGTGNDTITGASSNDTLSGQAGNDVMDGRAGNDRLNGLDGADTLTGGDGNDTLLGGLLNDLLGGGNGNDSLKGEDGDDTLNGGNDDDTLEGGPGNDSLNGGAGTNVLIP